MTWIHWAGLTCALSLALTGLCRTVAHKIGAVARPHADRWNQRPVALLGGIAISTSVLASGVALWSSNQVVWVLLGGACVMAVIGLVDDLRPLRPQYKLVAQLLVAASAVALGLELRLTPLPLVNFLITLAWVVGITNAFNLLDNMDGLAAGIAAIATAFRLLFFAMDGYAEGMLLSGIFLGGLLGFLAHNSHPARIFMGDTGSLFIGFYLSGLSLVGGMPYSRGTVFVLLVPVLILLVPIFDTTFVTLTRRIARRPISVGGKDHTSHRLVRLGLSERRAVLLLYLVAIGTGTVAYFSYQWGLSYGVVLIVFLVLGFGVLGTYLGRVEVYDEDSAPPGRDGFIRIVTNFQYKRQIITVLIDLLLIVVAYYTAYLLRFEDQFDAFEQVFIRSLPLVVVSELVALAAFRTYQGMWRYTGLTDLIRLGQALTVGSMAAVLLVVYLYRFEGFSRAVFILNWLLAVLFIGASRVSFRVIGEVLRPKSAARKRILIYGAGDGGILTIREMRNNAVLGREPVAFIDDDRTKQTRFVYGIPVLAANTADDLTAILREESINEVVISTERIPADRLALLRKVCEAEGVQVFRALLKLEGVP